MQFNILTILIFLVALEHIFICILEMFFSQTKLAIKIFGLKPNFVQLREYKLLMKNQGLYNGFLAFGLLWALFYLPLEFKKSVEIFFLSCVSVAGIYGGLTVKKSIFFSQALPALVALTILCFFS